MAAGECSPSARYLGDHGRTSFTSRHGYVLSCVTVAPKGISTSAGCIIFHHGLSDHCMRHTKCERKPIACALQLAIQTTIKADFQQIADATGLTVYMYDSAGHGLSGPSGPDDRGYVRSASELVTDLADFAEHVVSMRERELGDAGFICLAGYSMGATTALNTCVKHPGLAHALMLTAPLINPMEGVPPLGMLIRMAVIKLISAVRPKLPMVARRPVSWGINDPQEVAKMEADTLWYRGKHRVGTVRTLLKISAMYRGNVGKVAVPMFLQQGTEDRACLISACRRLLPRMKGKVDLTYLEIPGGFHDLHHDLNKEKCAAGSIRFLKGQMAAQGAKQ